MESQKNQQTITESITIGERDEAFKKILKDFNSQSELIKSLKVRIEELETDSLIKNQDAEKQKFEIKQLRQELNEIKNIIELSELKKMKQEIVELKKFKSNYTDQIKLDKRKSLDKFEKTLDDEFTSYLTTNRDTNKLEFQDENDFNNDVSGKLVPISRRIPNNDVSSRLVTISRRIPNNDVSSRLVPISGRIPCGVKITIGEKFYRCQTCASRNDSILCKRCYMGTNHIGHDVTIVVSSDASAWCDCSDPAYWKTQLNCKYHSSNMSGSSQCGAKLAIGETYYKCKTCATETTSVLCRRCYEGTNHGGHDVKAVVNRDASNWCDCGDLDYWKLRLNCKYHSFNISEYQCGTKLAVGEKYYKCMTCATETNCVLCRRCYEGTNHSGHDVRTVVNSNASNWCDCGDLNIWKLRLNCKYHSPNISGSFRCGTKLAVGEKYYKCMTCAAKTNCILCRRCYEGTNHNGHDVRTVVNHNPSNWCDCGDSDCWKAHLNCRYHPASGK